MGGLKEITVESELGEAKIVFLTKDPSGDLFIGTNGRLDKAIQFGCYTNEEIFTLEKLFHDIAEIVRQNKP